MKPYRYQQELSIQAVDLLREYMIAYLAMEERTGKTLTAILAVEQLNVKDVLVLTKKKALDGWKNTLKAYEHKKNYTVINYHQAWKLVGEYDLVILDEAHNYISAYPKIGASSAQLAELRKAGKPNRNIYDAAKKLTKAKPLLYLSATPYAQGPQLLFHQLSLSSWSPWHHHKNFYAWFKLYGKPYTLKVQGREVNQYDKCHEQMILDSCKHLFISKTRKELGFKHEPTDQLHYIELSQATKDLYNTLVKDQIVYFDEPLVCDTVAKLRASLHMLEGGVAKIEESYMELPNQEKIDFIKAKFSDRHDLVIMYNYIAEKAKLEKHFKKAAILQATSYAEGVDLHKYKDLVIYSQDFSTARHTQRRARQANKQRKEPITVHYLLVKKAISEQVYKTVSVNKKNFVDSVFEREVI